MKTLLELLVADRAVEGDVYRIGNAKYALTKAGASLRSGESYLYMDIIGVLSAEGWVRVTPAIPLPPARIEFVTTVERYGIDDGTIVHPGLNQFGHKRVKVTVEELS